MALPPLSAGAAHVRLTTPSPGTAARLWGAVGIVLGVAVVDAAVPAPAVFKALICKMYAVPLVRLVKVNELAVAPPGTAVQVPPLYMASYPVTSLPPLEAGGENVTVTCILPGEALRFCGAEGVVYGAAVIVAAIPVPMELIALTVKV